MRKLTLTHGDEKLTARVPEGWHETPLAAYARLAAATTVPARCEALATLVGLPAQALHDDVSLYGRLLDYLPVALFRELPEATAPVPSFTHEGTAYAHIGHLHTISSGQLEALYNFNAEHEGNPLAAGPGLLAVLYCPVGKAQTAEVVRDAAAALATLPMHIAWPAIADFMKKNCAQNADFDF